MISNTYTVPSKVTSRIYKYLASTVGPANTVKHFGPSCFYAQFGPFTLTSVPGEEGGESVVNLYFHGSFDSKLVQMYHQVKKKISTFPGMSADALNPFS